MGSGCVGESGGLAAWVVAGGLAEEDAEEEGDRDGCGDAGIHQYPTAPARPWDGGKQCQPARARERRQQMQCTHRSQNERRGCEYLAVL